MKYFFYFLAVVLLLIVWIPVLKKDSSKRKPSIWIETWYPMDSNHLREGKSYNDLIKLNDKQYLFVGKNFKGTFDSSIITINP